MFDNLSNNFTKIFDKLTRKSILSEDDINAAMREIRIALLEADVPIKVIKDILSDDLKKEMMEEKIIKSISPGQMVAKLVQDYLIKILGSESSELRINTSAPVVIMMVGLQGSGKTTSSAKFGYYLKDKKNKKTLLASLDTIRPAAQQQLAIIAKDAKIDSLPIIENQKPLEIAKRAQMEARLGSYDILILDTAGRLHIDNDLMNELIEIKKLTNPVEIILVVDAMMGQDSLNIATEFDNNLDITGVILSRIDGDTRGGAALSIKSVTGKAIKFLAVGEKYTDLEEFHPDRIASRILGMGDIISLVEKAANLVGQEELDKLNKQVEKGRFDLNDLANQFKNLKKMGGIANMVSMIPGMGKLKDKLNDDQLNDKIISKKEAIIYSMTPRERSNPKILNGSRKKRIAVGAGVQVQDVNKLLKEYQAMSDMVKKWGGMDKKSLLRSGIGKLFG